MVAGLLEVQRRIAEGGRTLLAGGPCSSSASARAPMTSLNRGAQHDAYYELSEFPFDLLADDQELSFCLVPVFALVGGRDQG